MPQRGVPEGPDFIVQDNEELKSYLTRHNKSFWGFLLRCWDAIVTSATATSRRQDLEGTWVGNFLLEARKLGEDLEEM
ncbi:1471_t:CDS:2, partial [Cetraspora pellucida]